MFHALKLINAVYRHKANKNRKLRAVFSALQWQVEKHLMGESSYKDKSFDTYGIQLRCYRNNHIASAAIYFNGLPDYEDLMFMKRYLRPGDHFIDIGANIGLYSLSAAAVVGAEGGVEAFEALPNLRERLMENARLNGFFHIRAHENAVGKEEGEIEFVLSNDCMGHIKSAQDDASENVLVQVKPLDICLSENRQYSMGKMDIEGAEFLALQGAEKMLAKMNPPVWQLELGGYSKRYGTRTDEIVTWLKNKKYDTAFYDEAKNSLRFDDEPWKNPHDNVLAVARDMKGWVEKRLQTAV